jgi:hypothetical protein
MTIKDYLLIGAVAAAAIYTVYRLFLGWRNSAFRQDKSENGGEPNAPTEAQPIRRVATGAPWTRRAERLNASNFQT